MNKDLKDLIKLLELFNNIGTEKLINKEDTIYSVSALIDDLKEALNDRSK